VVSLPRSRSGGRSSAPALRVLLSAFACGAGRGSEPGIGWGWARALSAAGHDVTVLTRPTDRCGNTSWLRDHPDVELMIEYVEESQTESRLRRVGGRAARALAYGMWQEHAYRRARQLHARCAFDVVHHVTLGTVVPGSPMWRLGAPFVFGPVGSGQVAPPASAALFGRAWRHERRRSALVALTRANPFAVASVRQASVVLTPNCDSALLIRSMGARRVELMSDCGVDPADIRRGARRLELSGRRPLGRPRVIWVGSMIPRKGVSLAIDAFARTVRSVDAELHLVGDGPLAGEVASGVAARRLTDRVVFHGRVSWHRVHALLATADVMLMPSLRDTFGSQVVEGAAAGLPLVAVDLHGVAALVPPEAAVKVPFSTPSRTAAGLADGLVSVLTDGDMRSSMSRAMLRFAAEQSWYRRAARVTDLYRTLIAGSGP
jgi:glycosyltransferase involved in cell wall biosynthesis